MKISIIGTGYVGLPTACAFAEYGHNVVCVDTDEEKIKKLKNNEATIYEVGLQEVLNKVGKNILFTTDYASTTDSSVIFITVGTPMKENGEADLTYINQVANSIKDYTGIVVIKSTVPVGTGDKIQKLIPNATLVSMPEFLREGYALEDVFNPDRIIIGTNDNKVFEKLCCIYPLDLQSKIYKATRNSAELIKYASNAFLAIKIHYINEIADLCQKVDANVNEVAFGMGLDSRIGKKFLRAGIGYGGSCFPKDTNAIYQLAENKGVDLSLVGSAINGNRKRQKNFAVKINKYIQQYKPSKVAMLGLAFKEGTDDVRESPAINVLRNIDYPVTVYDPKATFNAKKVLKDYDNITYADTMEYCLKDAGMVIIATEWQQFSNIPLDILSKNTTIKKPIVIDLRNILNSSIIKTGKIYYKGI